MKTAIHPNYKTAKVTCMSCGTTFETGSTADELKIDVCSKCHPFYTGKQRTANAGGRVDRFKKKYKID